MPRAAARLALSRHQILGHRRQAGALDERLPAGARSLRVAAWAGLQDSMPRAALLSIHARVEGATPSMWEHPSLVQLWGPRYSAYVVASKDIAVFALGRLPENERAGARARETAARLHTHLKGRRMPFGVAGHEMRVPHNSLRYAATTGTVLMRWDGARQPEVWTVPPPRMAAADARLELARRFLHVFGPSTEMAFARWAGLRQAEARRAFVALHSELIDVRTPIGDGWILASDESTLRAPARAPAAARLLPSGDAYFLAWGRDRELLVPEAARRAWLWTSRVWPGAMLVDGEIGGTWRRDGPTVSADAWHRLTAAEWAAVEAEAAGLPLAGPIVLERSLNGSAVRRR